MDDPKAIVALKERRLSRRVATFGHPLVGLHHHRKAEKGRYEYRCPSCVFVFLFSWEPSEDYNIIIIICHLSQAFLYLCAIYSVVRSEKAVCWMVLQTYQSKGLNMVNCRQNPQFTNQMSGTSFVLIDIPGWCFYVGFQVGDKA
jgi:hypothetical protein